MNHFAYGVRANEPCIFVEIFLPKKAELQGILYETLTRGFRRQVVIDHFLNADLEKMQAIVEMLGKGWTVFPAIYPQAVEIRSFPRLFFGYSTYEVDGVFLKEKENKPKDKDGDEWYSIVEDRTQVIRLIFKYECFDRPIEEIDFCKAALRDPLSEIGTFQENYPYLEERMKRLKDLKHIDIAASVLNLDRWNKYVGLFLFGYLLFNICDKIESLCNTEGGQQSPAAIQQDEIWVSSSWSVNMNVIKWSKLGV
jgi:hypothetical protein